MSSDPAIERSMIDEAEKTVMSKIVEGSNANELVGSYAGQRKQRIFKIIIIGDSNVGKTCLSFRFCEGKFPEKSEATIGVDFREKNVDIGGETVQLQIWDTAGQERFRRSMVQHYYRNVHAVVFVYDVTKMSSFENLPIWIDECKMHDLGREIPKIVVGNKCDLQEKIVVDTNVAQRFADINQMPLFETSVKDNSKVNHVESIFLTLAHKLKNCKPWMPPPSPNTESIHVQLFTSPNSRHTRNHGSPEPEAGYCPC